MTILIGAQQILVVFWVLGLLQIPLGATWKEQTTGHVKLTDLYTIEVFKIPE